MMPSVQINKLIQILSKAFELGRLHIFVQLIRLMNCIQTFKMVIIKRAETFYKC